MHQQLIRFPELLQRVPLCRSEIYRLVSLGEFPRPVPLGKRVVAFDASAVDAWITARVAASGDTADRAKIGHRLVKARAARAKERTGKQKGGKVGTSKRQAVPTPKRPRAAHSG